MEIPMKKQCGCGALVIEIEEKVGEDLVLMEVCSSSRCGKTFGMDPVPLVNTESNVSFEFAK